MTIPEPGSFVIIDITANVMFVRAIGTFNKQCLYEGTTKLKKVIDKLPGPIYLLIDIQFASPSGATAPPVFIKFLKNNSDKVAKVALLSSTFTGSRGFLFSMVKRLSPVPMGGFIDVIEARSWLLLQ